MDKKKEHILTMATALFLDKGFRNTSVQDIALACNMSKATIYKYFSSKEELGLAVALFINEQMREACRSILETPALNGCEKLLEITYIFIDDFMTKGKFNNVLIYSFSPEQKKQYMPILANYRFQLYRELTQAIAAAFMIADESAAWELTINFGGLLQEISFFEPEATLTLDRALLANFILDSLSAIARQRQGKPQLIPPDYLAKVKAHYSSMASPTESICPRSRLIEELRSEITYRMPAEVRKELLEALSTLEQECRKAIPTPMMINVLCTYLAQHKQLSAAANALMELYQEKNRSEQK